jgi:hypothetical protein
MAEFSVSSGTSTAYRNHKDLAFRQGPAWDMPLHKPQESLIAGPRNPSFFDFIGQSALSHDQARSRAAGSNQVGAGQDPMLACGWLTAEN